MSRALTKRLVVPLSVVAMLALTGSAQAAFPGQNGKLVFGAYEPGCAPSCDLNLYTAGPDGSGRAPLVTASGSEFDPQWSSDGGAVAYGATRSGNTDVYRIGASGGVEQRLTTDPAADSGPAWTPDGERLVFASSRAGTSDLWTMNADGTGAAQQLTSGPASDSAPAVSPDGSRIAFTRRAGGCTSECPVDIYVMDIDGSDVAHVPIRDHLWYCEWRGPSKTNPDWSPGGDRIVFAWNAVADCDYELDWIPSSIETIRPDGSGQRRLRYYSETDATQAYEPVFSPDGARVVFETCCAEGELLRAVDADGGGNEAVLLEGFMPDWQPLPVDALSSHARPAGATPLRASLVPAHEECTDPNRAHAPPLAHPSCAPPVPGSPNLTVGVGDGDPAFARSIGFVRISVRPGMPGGADDAEAVIRSRISNVMRRADLSEYTGALRASVTVRLTDKDGAVSQTAQDFPLEWDMPCAPTAEELDKSLCELTTTLDALRPGAAAEGTRAIWDFDQMQVYDGGPDEDVDTEGDNSLFAVQGVFIP